jgi:hypothetical protein
LSMFFPVFGLLGCLLYFWVCVFVYGLCFW